ncbi:MULTISPECIES: DUF1993 family protein [unclassified Janthinobacterium]|uniref:DUF1993 domain-containing protein n=1 Tax=unclassified Janthinobacterium TaxID=2610881 RepID=UPI00160C38FD|nr:MULTISPECIES: DUF1993 domain-containing protein [unclassified Janthinobacterium]MBB5371206.1 hypothetical protein [Janthinobacterium sp. K2C7]MBB5384012.1 hypothetical protein [Janthinobacterium sp. K2Li3]MBB5389166.1 hypothetical protein [Janthinobacterium sp. K2E3]
MSVSMYQATVPVFIRGLRVVSNLLEKAQSHVEEGGIVPEIVLGAQLAPDMLDLTAQVQRASDTSKLSIERLSGVAAPKFEDNEVSFEQLQERIANTIAYIESVNAGQLAGSAQREVVLNWSDEGKKFSGDDYLLSFALPNFYFHVSIIHAILRSNGVAIGKLDFLGPYD